MKQHSVLLAIHFACTIGAAQPTTQWQKSFGGSLEDFAFSVQQTSDAGYIVGGASVSNDGDVTGNHGSFDYWVVKLDEHGDLQWQKSLGGSDEDRARSIQQTSDGGHIVAGYSRSNDGDVTGNHGDFDYWVVRLDGQGDVQWERSLGGSDWDAAQSIQQTSDGGFIVAGYSRSNDGDVTGNHGNFDYWVVKLDGQGDIQWEKSLGGSYWDAAYNIQQTSDGEYIVVGQSASKNGDVTGNHGNFDYWVVKLDGQGDIQWQRSLGGSDDDYAHAFQQTIDGGYIIAGHSSSNDGDVTANHGLTDIWVVKLDASGNIQWQRSLGGSGYEYAASIQQTIDVGYMIAGESRSNDGDVTANHGLADIWVVNLDAQGNIQWQRSFGGSGVDDACCIQQTSDGGYTVAGATSSVDGDVTSNHGRSDCWIVKLGPDSVGTGSLSNRTMRAKVSPNPAELTVSLYWQSLSGIHHVHVTDLLGQIVDSRSVQFTEGTSRPIQLQGIAPGIYSVIIASHEHRPVGTVIIH